MLGNLKTDIVVSFVARAWVAMVGLIFVPLYINIMGVEAYGLVGIYVTLQTIASILDLGLSTTLNRELARYAVHSELASEARDLVRSLEVFYWAIASLVGLGVALSGSFLSSTWIQATDIESKTIAQAIALMGGVLAFQLPLTFYSGGLMGLQQQTRLNLVAMVMATMRSLGAVFVLRMISSSIVAFFSWQLVVSMVHTLIIGQLLWHSLPVSEQRASIRFSLIRKIWRFAAGMSGIAVLTILLTQVDKIVLSRLLSLEQFGYYALASTVANGLYSLIGPIFTVLFPRFTRLVSAKDEERLQQLYHQSCQLMSVVILPITAVIALFSHEIMLLWTGNVHTTDQTALLVSCLIIGTALNGLMNMPYALQLAYGWTSLALYQNLVATLILVPMMIWAVTVYGALGAAIIWVLLNLSYLLIGVQIMHTRLLTSEKLVWYYRDIGLPLAATLCVTLAMRLALPNGLLPLMVAGALGTILISAMLFAILSAPDLRRIIRTTMFRV